VNALNSGGAAIAPAAIPADPLSKVRLLILASTALANASRFEFPL
jgi:hypothetical protein